MPVRGAVDGVVGRFVVGWAHDAEDAERRVELEVELDGEPAGAGVADLERADLRTAGIGDGRHAFRIELPGPLQPGTDHILAVRPLDGGPALPLANDCFVQLEAGLSGAPVVLRAPSAITSAEELDHADGWLHGSEVPKALVGRDGWLFEYHPPEVMQAMLGRRSMDEASVAERGERLRNFEKRLRALGVQYIVAVVPDKATLYAEHLPEELRVAAESRAAKLIADSLHDDDRIDLLDLLRFLSTARRHDLLYPRTGTQLTWRGAFHAYRALAKELAKRWPAIEPIPVDGFRLGTRIAVRPSLGARELVVPVGEALYTVVSGPPEAETEDDLAPRLLRATYAIVPREIERLTGPEASVLSCAKPQLPTSLMVVHDGAGARIAGLLAEHFASTLVVVGDEPPFGAAEQQGVQVVVQLIREATICGS
jgi:hypothetical protein